MLLNTNFSVIEEWLGDYSMQSTGSAIAKKKDLNQKTVANHLNLLEQEHILKSTTQGKNRLYFLNRDNAEIVRHFIIAAEHMRTIRFYKQQPLLHEISTKISPHIKGVAVLFGSYAKGTPKKDSDIDVLIIGSCDEEQIDKIAKIYRKDISLKIYPEVKRDILMQEVMKDHIILKNAELFVEEMFHE
ncbi:MAG: nucleotidyltransferase domain-containing protein [Nanoarchaeota archaeon]